MRAPLFVLAVAIRVLALLSASAEEQRLPAIRVLADTKELWCWYVESNSAGKHGYAAQDARLDSWFPDRTELFENIADFKGALGALGLSHLRLSTSAPITRPPLYIRPLTDLEMEQLCH